MGEVEVYITFRCSQCGVQTDLKDGYIPSNIRVDLPQRGVWSDDE